jgi:hypothetical protein
MLGAVANDKHDCLYIRCHQQNSCVGCGDHNEQDPLIAILVRPALVTLRFTVAEEYILVRAALVLTLGFTVAGYIPVRTALVLALRFTVAELRARRRCSIAVGSNKAYMFGKDCTGIILHPGVEKQVLNS